MALTIILSLAGCALLFFGIWGVTVTMPTKLLAKNFPEDVQERLKPRLEEWEHRGMSLRRFLGWIIMVPSHRRTVPSVSCGQGKTLTAGFQSGGRL